MSLCFVCVCHIYVIYKIICAILYFSDKMEKMEVDEDTSVVDLSVR